MEERETERLSLSNNRTGRAILIVTLAMLALGVVMVHSAVASVSDPGKWYARVDVRHTMFALLASIVLITFWRFDYRLLGRGARFPAAPTVLLIAALICGVLVFVPGLGRSVGGYYRWIRLGPAQYQIQFQPSELIKISLLIFLAAWISRKSPTEVRSFGRTFVPAAVIIGACVSLVITQDFGTAALIGVAAVVTLLLGGVPWYQLMLLIPPAALGFYVTVVRNPHRWRRIAAMLEDPLTSTHPAAYQPRQALLAILSGGWFGKGPGNGAMKLGFLPEDSTDFIFSVFCEEWGFIGAMGLMGLIAMWIYFARKAAVGASDAFGRILVGSLGFAIAIQAVGHLAVNLVLAPPTGISLPFISAGGTALLLMSGAVAMIVSVTSRAGASNELSS